MSLLQKAMEKGTDKEYQAYIRQWPSCVSGAYNEVVNGEGRSIYAHARLVAHGAGTGIKPPYSGTPVTNDEHLNEYAICPVEWWGKKANEYLANWINGVKPPAMEEQKAHWKKEYLIEHPGQIYALELLLKKHFSREGAPNVKCTLQRAVNRRSGKQNNAQWGVIYGQALEFYEKHPQHLVTDMLKAFRFGVHIDFIHHMFKPMFNHGKSTAKLSTVESKEYFERIQEHFLHKYQYEIKEPVSPDMDIYC